MVKIRQLSPAEIESYDFIPSDLAQRVKIIKVPILLGPYIGISIGRFIFIKIEVPDDGSSTLIAHELVHVRQWAELGVVGFIKGYLGDFTSGLVKRDGWRNSYKQIALEKEARIETGRWSQHRHEHQHRDAS